MEKQQDSPIWLSSPAVITVDAHIQTAGPRLRAVVLPMIFAMKPHADRLRGRLLASGEGCTSLLRGLGLPQFGVMGEK